jgi:hypothetical protein
MGRGEGSHIRMGALPLKEEKILTLPISVFGVCSCGILVRPL